MESADRALASCREGASRLPLGAYSRLPTFFAILIPRSSAPSRFTAKACEPVVSRDAQAGSRPWRPSQRGGSRTPA
jgi:hypothetical protein